MVQMLDPEMRYERFLHHLKLLPGDTHLCLEQRSKNAYGHRLVILRNKPAHQVLVDTILYEDMVFSEELAPQSNELFSHRASIISIDG